jgi:hypothetical protein
VAFVVDIVTPASFVAEASSAVAEVADKLAAVQLVDNKVVASSAVEGGGNSPDIHFEEPWEELLLVAGTPVRLERGHKLAPEIDLGVLLAKHKEVHIAGTQQAVEARKVAVPARLAVPSSATQRGSLS